jgi:diguanylate cyclase (GGDEF)-like protein/PAS domain S-box-containing protein
VRAPNGSTLHGGDPLGTLFAFFCGHALGNVAFTPLAMMLMGARARRETMTTLRSKAADALLVLPLTAVVALIVFGQQFLPLLFLPVMIIILATFRMGRVGTAAAVAIVALVGGVLTGLGHGPTQLIPLEIGPRMLFFQFYLAATVLTVLPVSADLHARVHMLRRVRISEERFRMITEHSADTLMQVSIDGRIRYVSPAIRRTAGYDPMALVGRSSLTLVAPEDRVRVRQENLATLAAAGAINHYDYLAVLADGSHRWCSSNARALFDENGNLDGVLVIARDISERKEREAKLERVANTDSLTGLPNRHALFAHVEDLGRRGCALGTTIALLDIDHFKRVNDDFGHAVGDAVLRQLSVIARQMLRTHDYIARIGGEEFVVVLPETSAREALAICDRLRAQVANGPMIVGKVAVPVTVSGGVAVLGGSTLDAALKAADLALYTAKSDGRDQMRLAA